MIEQRLNDRTPLEDTTVDIVDLESGVEFQGEGRNVSGTGLAFASSMEPPVGADMKVTVKGKTAELRVTRVERTDSGFDVAGKLRQR